MFALSIKMKLIGKQVDWEEIRWFLVLTPSLWLLYRLCLRCGMSNNASKGVSLLLLIVIVVISLFVFRAWELHRERKLFDGLSFTEKCNHMERLFEEAVASGMITQGQLDEAKAKAEGEFENIAQPPGSTRTPKTTRVR